MFVILIHLESVFCLIFKLIVLTEPLEKMVTCLRHAETSRLGINTADASVQLQKGAASFHHPLKPDIQHFNYQEAGSIRAKYIAPDSLITLSALCPLT